MAVVGTAILPGFLTRAVFAAETLSKNKRLVVIFQRGAADGLNIVIPHGERAYFQMRPTIAIPQREIINLDGMFGLHPQMSALKPLWDQGHLAIVHAAGSPDTTRSHFDAQDYMESGTPGVKSTEDGWLNRALKSTSVEKQSPFRAVALGNSLPRMLAGSAPAVAVSISISSRPERKLSPRQVCRGTAADSSTDERQSRRAGRIHRYRRMGSSRQ
jgi:uncharacterized protein (DUF1501 family)